MLKFYFEIKVIGMLIGVSVLVGCVIIYGISRLREQWRRHKHRSGKR